VVLYVVAWALALAAIAAVLLGPGRSRRQNVLGVLLILGFGLLPAASWRVISRFGLGPVDYGLPLVTLLVVMLLARKVPDSDTTEGEPLSAGLMVFAVLLLAAYATAAVYFLRRT
jgi:hypothetical protein